MDSLKKTIMLMLKVAWSSLIHLCCHMHLCHWTWERYEEAAAVFKV